MSEREAFEKWCNDNHLFDTSNFIHDAAERSAAQERNITWLAWQAAIQRGRELEKEESSKQEPFGYWHVGETENESDFFLHKYHGDVSCENCVKLYTKGEQT